MQSQNTKQEKSASNMTTYFQNLTVNFNSYVGIEQSDMTDKDIDFIKFIHQKNSNSEQEKTFT